MKRLLQVTLRAPSSVATFGIVTEDDWCTQAAPIGRWMIGKHLTKITNWVSAKGGDVKDLGEVT